MYFRIKWVLESRQRHKVKNSELSVVISVFWHFFFTQIQLCFFTIWCDEKLLQIKMFPSQCPTFCPCFNPRPSVSGPVSIYENRNPPDWVAQSLQGSLRSWSVKSLFTQTDGRTQEVFPVQENRLSHVNVSQCSWWRWGHLSSINSISQYWCSLSGTRGAEDGQVDQKIEEVPLKTKKRTQTDKFLLKETT